MAVRLLLVVAGGGIGSAARYLVAIWMAHRFDGFPWATLTVNVTGSFVIGVLATLADETGSIGPHARLFLLVGVLGGFTTFSSFSLETLRLVDQAHQPIRALLNVLASVSLSLAAATAGIVAARAMKG